MFKVHVENAELLLEDCRAGANGWLRVSSSPHQQREHGAPSVEIEKITTVSDDKLDANFTPIHAVYGIYSLLSGPYLAVIQDSRVIGSGPNSEKIYCILELELIPVSAAAHRSFFKHASKREKKDEEEYVRMIKSVVASRTFYFSYDYDLTLSAQRRANNSASSNSQKLPMWQKAEEDFFWNKPLLTKFIERDLHNWIIPVISGFVKVMKKCEINGMRCDLLFFTRRSWRRVGTRFNVRGVDKDGFVANFAETEMMIVKPNRSICSYVQIRGSIPLYWDQMVTLKYMPRTRYAFSGNESIVDWNELAFRAHMDNIIQRYGHVTVVNLIDRAGKSKTVRDQAQLGSAYGKYVKKYNQQSRASDAQCPVPAGTATSSPTNSSPKHRSMSVSGSAQSSPSNGSNGSASTNGSSAAAPAAAAISQLFTEPIAYVWFDFHHECRKMQWGNLSKLITEVNDQFNQYGWFECDGEGRLVNRQKGVFRVNCMDNLDRTNVVMSLFARRCTLMSLGLHDDSKAATPASVLDSPYEAFELVFKNAWADNADYVSKMYAGTGALKTDFTRTGKRTISGAIQDGINSVTRYYLNNFADGVRQDAYDLLVGNFLPDKRDESPFTFQQQHSLVNFVMELSLMSVVIVSVSMSMRPEEELATRVRDGLAASLVIFAVTGYLILKKGILRTLGRRYVCKPAFCSSGYIKRKDS
uniref:SAC domain-containing protein n=1 Tax=Globisporangium ultimum (strain ATCC 200006 / CBS 805.95 / DAOM BR144) TaxID=431595 RepID=K3WWY9_GLOUD